MIANTKPEDIDGKLDSIMSERDYEEYFKSFVDYRDIAKGDEAVGKSTNIKEVNDG